MTESRSKSWKIVDHLLNPKRNWILVVLPALALFGPMLLAGRSLFWGTPMLQFIPWREFALETINNGHFPLWNPALGMGAPLIANYQSAVFYPPNWVLLLTGSAWGHGLLVLFHLIWAGLGMLFLARNLNMGVFAQTLAGISFSLSAYLVSRASFLSINAAAAWLPWILLAAHAMTRATVVDGSQGNRRRFQSMLLLGLALAFQWLAGHAQTSWYSLILSIVWVSWFSFRQARLRGLWRAGAGFLMAALIAFALSAIQLLPTLEYLLNSQRASDLSLEAAFSYSFWPWRFLTFLIPNLFGNPASGDYWGYANFWEDAVYIGILPLLLAALGALRGIRDKKFSSLTQLLLFTTFFSFVFALGKNTPIFPYLFENIPTFDLFLAPTRWSLLGVFSLSLLAGLGAELWLQRELVPLFWVRLGTVGAATLSAVALLSALFLSDLQSTFVPAIAAAGLWLAIFGALAWRRRLRPHAIWPLIAIVLLAADLILAGVGLNPTLESSFFEGTSALRSIVDDEHRVYMPAAIEQDLKFIKTHRFDTFFPEVDWVEVRNAGLPNVTMLDGIASANNFDPLLSQWYTAWIEQLEMASSTKQLGLLRLMDVGWLVIENNDPPLGIEYAQLEAPRRVRLVGNAKWVESEEDALIEMFSDAADLEDSVVLLGEPEAPVAAPAMLPIAGDAFDILEDENPNHVVIEVSVENDGWLILSDQWYPGWTVRIDGLEAKILRANYLFRGVKLPAGNHIVEFKYSPASFSIGGVISLIALLIFGLALWFARKI